MSDITISKLLKSASAWMTHEFEYIRKTGPHSGQKGTEVETILIEFLNRHLPRRFSSSSGFVIDSENNLSKQLDVVIYDALTSPVYRTTQTSQIVPADNLAAVIEVKTSLNKAELAKSFETIASCKRLKKRPWSEADRKATGSDLYTTTTFGIVFAFDSDTSLRKLTEHVWELNSTYDSTLWPDLIVVLGRGIIHYQMGFPSDEGIGMMMPPASPDFTIPAAYVYLTATEDPEFALSRFFMMLLSHLTFFAYRLGTPPFDIALEGGSREAFVHDAYQFNAARQLRPVPAEMRELAEAPGIVRLNLFDSEDRQIGQIWYVPWQDGMVLASRGFPILPLIALLLGAAGADVTVVRRGGMEWSSFLTLTVEEFATWPELLAQKGNVRGKLVTS